VAIRDENGRFVPGGGSGNPSGRSIGAVLLQVQLRKELEAVAPDAIKRLGELVKKGNLIAIKFIVERTIPAPRSGPIAAPVTLEGTAVEQAERIISEMSGGAISMEDGLALMSALANAQRVRESAELHERLAAIEQCLAALTGDNPPALPRPSAALPAPKADRDAT
jgi:hypothetical protein